LLILSCSSRKRDDHGLLAAIERYDGPAFRTLRHFLRSVPNSDLDFCVLSAEFGLISGQQPIPWYDRRMNPERARDLLPAVSAAIRALLEDHRYQAILIHGGAMYRATIDNDIAADLRVKITSGSIGLQLSALRAWLYGDQTPAPLPRLPKLSRTAPKIRGVTLDLSTADVLDRARSALSVAHVGSDRSVAWYVDVDGQRVSAKWLVSQLTGLPASAFVTTEARRVLGQLGIEVRHR
jgi:hypothetical protein